MSIEKTVKDFIANDDNVEFMSGIKDVIYSKLSDNEDYASIAAELSDYTAEYDEDPESFKHLDDIVNKDDDSKDDETPPKDKDDD